MRLLKTRGGLTGGRGMTENVTLTWVHTVHECVQVHNAMIQLTGNHHQTSNQRGELGASWIKRHNDELEKIKLWIENHNPFYDNEPLLRSIATGLTGPEGDGITCDEVEKIGQAIQDQLDGISITEATIKKKDQMKTLEFLKIGEEIEKEKIHVDSTLLFSRLLHLIEREKEIRQYFQFELTEPV